MGRKITSELKQNIKNRHYREDDFVQKASIILSKIRHELRPKAKEIGLKMASFSKDRAVACLSRLPGLITQIRPDHQQLFVDNALKITRVNWKCGDAFIRHLSELFERVSVFELENWVDQGIKIAEENVESGIAYFGLRSATSNRILNKLSHVVRLAQIAPVLKVYARALSGKELHLTPLSQRNFYAIRPGVFSYTDGKNLFLPDRIFSFDDSLYNFSAYKAYVAHLCGYFEFRTRDFSIPKIFQDMSQIKAPKGVECEFKENQSCFKFQFWTRKVLTGDNPCDGCETIQKMTAETLIKSGLSGFPLIRGFVDLFSDQYLAHTLFFVLEGGRIASRLRSVYKGIKADIDRLIDINLSERPRLSNLPLRQAAIEALVHLCSRGCVEEEMTRHYSQMIQEIAPRVEPILAPNSTVEDTARATIKLYNLIEQIPNLMPPAVVLVPLPENEDQKRQTPLFSENREILKQLQGAEETDEAAEKQDVFYYDEWDYKIQDYLTRWCRITEKRVVGDDVRFVEDTVKKHQRDLYLIRKQFERIRPELLEKRKGLEDGEEILFDKAIERILDRKAGRPPNEAIYMSRDNKNRDVAALFLLDMSLSTRRQADQSSKTIIDIEKEALVFMAEALEKLKDTYAIFGFSGFGRKNIDFFVIKEFLERYSITVKRRIGAIEPQYNTRMGAAIRHSVEKLKRVEAQTKILILLSDGRPYDVDYSSDRRERSAPASLIEQSYCVNDTMMALKEAGNWGIKSLCITVDPLGDEYFKKICNYSNYIIIKQATSLPGELPKIYQNFTMI